MNYTIEEQRVLAVERASVELKKTILFGVVNGVMLEAIKGEALRIRNEAVEELKALETDTEYIEDFKKGFIQSFIRWYRLYIYTLTKADNRGIMKPYFNALKGDTNAKPTLVIGTEGITEEVVNLRQFLPESETGEASFYADYFSNIKNAMVEASEKIANGQLSIIDSKGRQKSLRNMAEIYSRYQLINEDLKHLNSKFVVSSSHSNASERCSWHQGKVFIIDFDVATREMGNYDKAKAEAMYKGNPLGHTADGKPYYSLKEACECGFLSYNCRHRLVEYKAGMYVPQYDPILVERKRNIENKQRYIERAIRKQKTLEVIGLTPSERKQAREKSKQLQEKYNAYCEKNKVPKYEWRTRITDTERELEGLK